jgi:hypothetical protein
MADLRVESIKTTEDFHSFCPSSRLPWDMVRNNRGWTVFDADGLSVCILNGSRPDAARLAAMIVLSANTCGGYRATRE